MEKSKIKRLYKLLEVSQVLFGTLKHSWVVSGSQRYISSLVPLRSGSSLGASNSFKVIIRTTSRRSGANSSSPCLSGRRHYVPRLRGRDAVLDRSPLRDGLNPHALRTWFCFVGWLTCFSLCVCVIMSAWALMCMCMCVWRAEFNLGLSSGAVPCVVWDMASHGDWRLTQITFHIDLSVWPWISLLGFFPLLVPYLEMLTRTVKE